MRILVTGSRDWTDRQAILEAISVAVGWHAGSEVVVVHGKCETGADRLADMVARRLGFAVEQHPADWGGPCREDCLPGHRRTGRDGSTYCPKAGHHRNQEMVDLGADVVLAFQRRRSRGTQDCIDRARAAGFTVLLRQE